MTRVIRSESDLSRLLARPGYRVASQVGGEVVDTEQPKSMHVGKDVHSKYRNERTDGYASKKEARRAAELRVLQVQGRISNLREQVKYLVIPAARDADGKCIERACHYVADFVYDDERGNPVVEDCKGVRTDAYVIKRKLMYLVHGHKIKET
jgi:hypothetical protein